ncbi:hypothetical protein Y032_0022g485 [Ancylostoma ceylanicum]|uniref:Integrase catalytic domain-containing protein n=1 Tax=Ancylostoma ceylanicum TaxID=53326 RepID=A0A016UZF3_9BILA|nr:hypothetical protein Y032_0022g485 [Ancylostoma ceylanicum]
MINFSVSLPRRVTQREGCKKRTLSVFVDSSKRVYACVAYITTETEEERYTRLYCAKSKVAPISGTQTIPKLELLAIFIGMNMTEYIISKSGLKYDEVNIFSDSTIALAWIHSKKRLPSLVTKLTQKIQLSRERIANNQKIRFYHVPTEENVADHATRGLSREDAQNHAWFQGPKWLNSMESDWPVRPAKELSQTEEEECYAFLNTIEETHEIPQKKARIWPTEKISSYDKLKRVVAYSLRFLRNISNSTIAPVDNCCETFAQIPNAQEMQLAERYLIQEEQQQADLESLMRSCKNKDVKTDDCGLVRKFGRLQNADLSYNTVNPIYLPRKGLLNERIATQLHRDLAHCGSNQLVHSLRNKFWIPADKTLCRRTIRSCTTCQRHNAFPFKYPRMGPLPPERVTQSPPFSFTGVDMMGPLVIKNASKDDEKRYVALFTCLVTRMVHLEVATDLSARSFLLVFKRFTARRGVPLKIISDNGTNFRLSEAILSHEDSPSSSEFSLFLAKHSIQWNFIPPASPWMGGAWERMVGTVKRALLKTIGRRKVTEEILATFLCEIESVVNSRPLTVIGNHDDINDVLRPVDFIYKSIRHGTEVIPQEEQCQDDPPFQPTPEISTQLDAKRAILEAEKLTAKFWEKWKTEYLIELRERHVLYGNNYKSAKQPPQVGDVVLIDDDLRTSKDHWPMGLIQELVKSKDGEIRSAVLKTSTGRCTQRPINRLIPLEIHSTTQPEAVSSIESNEEPQQDIVANTDQHRRPVLERKAKKPVNYCENTTSVSTTSTKGGTQTMLLALIACSLLSSTTAAVLKCTGSGVQIDSRSISNTTFQSELCVNHRDCSIIQSTPPIHQQDLGAHQLINPYVVSWRALVNASQHVKEIKCPEQSICNAIHCTFCPLLLGNPECFPKTTIAVTATLLYIVTAVTIALSKLYGCIRNTTRKGNGDNHSVARAEIELMDLPEPGKPRHLEVSSIPTNRSRLLFVLSILAVMTLSTNSCQHTHAAQCRNTIDHTFTMSNFKREVCMKIEHKRDFIGTLHLQLDSIRFKCTPVIHFFTRNVKLQTMSTKRCAQAGSCTQHHCRTTGQTSFVPELNKSYQFPGITRCQESCGGIGCGCLLPMPGCLFSRTYAEPADESIYEVFSCASWTEVAVLKTRLNLNTGEEIKREVVIHPQETLQFGEMNITLDFITTPFIPELDRKFVQILNKKAPDTIIAHQDDISAVKCLTLQTARNLTKCRVIDTCSCTAKSVRNDCHCVNMNITERMNSIDTRLPLRSSDFRMEADWNTVEVMSHSSVAEISISTEANWTTATVIATTECDVTTSNARGCYNCIQGATVNFTCRSTVKTIAEVICTDHHYAIDCGPNAPLTTVVINSNTAHYITQCSAQCGERKHDLAITGLLYYHSIWKDDPTTAMNKRASYVNLINIPDIRNIADVITKWWCTSLIAAIAVAAAVFATILCGPLLLRKMSSLIC